MRSVLSGFALVALVLPGCGGDDDGSGDGAGRQDGGGNDRADAGPDEDGFSNLLTVNWSLPPPDGPDPDEYWCARKTLTEDLIITGYRNLSPAGTHHLVLSAESSSQPDNPGYPCNVLSNHSTLLFASGVGTDEFLFPEGVGIRVPAGQQLQLNVHLFNASEKPISGTSGVTGRKVDSVAVEAEFTFAGTFDIDIPQGAEDHPESGGCSIEQDATILNWWPHMHQLGTHMKIDVNGDVVHDEPFYFAEQKNYPASLNVTSGDTITVTCTYDGHPDREVGWGDGSNEEMCFAGFYRYPAIGQAYCATDLPF
jgi:hypothetical protein